MRPYYWYFAVALLVAVVGYMSLMAVKNKNKINIGCSVLNGTRSLLIRNGFTESPCGDFAGASDFEGLGSYFSLDNAANRVSASMLGAMSASNQQ